MFQRLYKSLGDFMCSRRDAGTDTYFASSIDIAELERRMRHVEQEAPSYTLPFFAAQ
ncbi:MULTISPECIES: DUF3563 family protein [unclassified Caballeronia]|uniref:DUF3563 family protein n=1 Tax=unclassified Caballeronia TaxID=2646786 RepID=UPI00285610BB|nr:MULTISPECIES: DUF3563 family protein [unclassified Caballeronia]MDR5739928.1 DUF3563 family protein [Caballeronia sp. LZ016]MDR5807321.1 DUF3563 family protein [Caballeronia sp. LZ019]